MSHTIRAEVEIDAPVARVWEILVDLDAYPEWNPFTPRLRSSLRVGEPVEMDVCLRPDRTTARVERVTACEPEARLCWDMKIVAPFLLAAERCQVLTPLAAHRTRYETADRFRGLLLPVMLWLYGDAVQRGFESVALALKKRAET